MLRDLEPRRWGEVRRDGQVIRYGVYGNGKRTLLLFPTWSIVHTDFWREQVSHFADRYSLLVFDGLGNGSSSRPSDPRLYADVAFAADAIAVMDDAGVERAASMSVSRGASWQLLAAAAHPDRVAPCVFIAPSVPLASVSHERMAAQRAFDVTLEEHPGWFQWNRNYWRDHWPEFLGFFFSKCFTEPNSEAHIAHFTSMGLETTPQVIAATVDAAMLPAEEAERAARALRCPTLVIHGDADEVAPLERGRRLAELSRGELVVLPGSGHEPQHRSPGDVNSLIDRFFEEHYAP